jgi:hypothetical protein
LMIYILGRKDNDRVRTGKYSEPRISPRMSLYPASRNNSLSRVI